MKKNKLIGLLATLSCVATLAGVGVANISASAETTLDGVDVSSFQMDNGASARYKAADNYTGIRFTATLDEDKYLELENKEKNTENRVTVDYGMLIVPYDLVKTNALTPESVFTGTATGEATDTKKYCVKNHETCNCGKTHIASVEYETLVDTTAGDKVYNLRGSLVEIQEHNLTREFVGVGYIEYTENGVSQYAFANYYGGNIENNVRSTVYVAQIALETTGDDANGTLQEKYITPFVSGALKDEFKYTVNHYLPDEEGAYKEENKKTETLYGTLNSEVAATNIAKSTLENKLDYAEYATYGFSTEQGETSGTLYANGKTVLNCYYKEQSTTLWSASDDADIALLNTANSATAMPDDFSATTEAGNYFEKVASYTDGSETPVTEKNVYKLSMHLGSKSNYTWAGGYFYLALNGDKLAIAENANWDYLTFRICIVDEQGNTGVNGAVMYNGSTMPLYGTQDDKVNSGIPFNTWFDFVVSKASLNNGNTASAIVPAGEQLTKQGFDDAFRAFTVNNAKPKDFFRMVNVLKDPVDYTLTYYIKDITWGVDYTAPEVEVAEEDQVAYTTTGSTVYTPSATVTDDYMKATTHYSIVIGGPTYTCAMYEVNGETRTLLTADDNGGYTLSKDKKYILAVTATSAKSASNLPANEQTKEYEIEVIDVSNGITFDSGKTIGMLAATTNSGVTPKISWKESEKDKEGVVVYETSEVSGAQYGAYFYLNFNDELINYIWKMYNDATTEFTFTLNMYVEIDETSGSYATNGVSLYGGKAYSYSVTQTKYEKNIWESYSFNETQLADVFGWATATSLSTTSSFYKQLSGKTYLFYLGWPTCVAGTSVTYYVDSITWTTTPNA